MAIYCFLREIVSRCRLRRDFFERQAHERRRRDDPPEEGGVLLFFAGDREREDTFCFARLVALCREMAR